MNQPLVLAIIKDHGTCAAIQIRYSMDVYLMFAQVFDNL